MYTELLEFDFLECAIQCFDDKEAQLSFDLFGWDKPLYVILLHSQIHHNIFMSKSKASNLPRNRKKRKIVSFLTSRKKKRVAILGFSFWLKCENEGIMKVFWCMPSTVMSSSILLQAFTKRCANSKWVTFSLKLKSFKSILSPQILLTWPWNWTWHVL